MPKIKKIKSRKIATFPKAGSAFIRVFTKFFIRLIALILLKGLNILSVLIALRLAAPGIRSTKLFLY